MSGVVWYPGQDRTLTDIVRAENCHLFDSSGRRYVDLESGVWCTVLGHAHPEIQRVIVEQSALVGHTGYNYSSGVVDAAATEVLRSLGFDRGDCVFLCSGSEAVEYGVRVAQSICNRPLLMTMADSYFGAYGSASRKQDDEWYLFDWQRSSSLDDVPFERIGGFLLEPGSSSGLVRFPPVDLVRGICDTVRENGGLILANEVTTGIGRTGRWFGFEHYGLSPDIVALGKGLGNGYPVSTAVFAPGVIDRLDSQLKYAQSHQNDPLGAAIALEVLRIVRRDGLVERGSEIADALRGGLEGIAARTNRIDAIRSRGPMLALELTDDETTSVTTWVHAELVRRGYLVGRRVGLNVFRLDPALTIDLEDIREFLEALEETLLGRN